MNVLISKKDILYIIKHLYISWYYYFLSVLLFIAIALPKRRWRDGILAGYMFFVFSLTILCRPVRNSSSHLIPLWSYMRWGLTKQNKANVLMFSPIGALGGKSALVIAAVYSFFIEVLQFATHRGTLDVDDFISNILGAMIGFFFVWVFRLLISRVIPRFLKKN